MNPRVVLRHFRFAIIGAFLGSITFSLAQTPPPPAKRLPPAGIAIAEKDRAELTAGVAALGKEIAELRDELRRTHANVAALLPDVEVFHKAVDWALRYDEFFAPKEITFARKLLEQGRERAGQLRAGRAPWLKATGLIVRGYRSKLDGSIQPYGLVVPAAATAGPRRMMVWLLGRSEKRTELAFIGEREGGPPQLTPADTLTLVPYGRFCNATKFAGEVDVFEAMDAVQAQYQIDRDRITVAGFSMGGASVWHLATHHAGLWCAASPGAGFAETAIYNNALAPGKLPRTPWEQTLWHWYNATDYAANLFNLPLVAYSGEIDPQKQSADLMEEAMAKEGLKLERLIGPNTAHKYHPETKKELTARLEALAAKGRDPLPRELHVTTYTTRYPGESWAQITGLEKHWERADLVARREGAEIFATTKNVSQVRLRPALTSYTVEIDGQKIAVPASAASVAMLSRDQGKWKLGDESRSQRKHHGLSGPIDDAFMDPFLFVRPTGKPLHEKTGAWAAAELQHATKMWRDIFRAELRVKDDTAVTADDLATKNLILWGDPASNSLIGKMLATGKLPLKWDAQKLTFRGRDYDAATHTPILIYPNPLNAGHTIVLNSGIDFRDEAYGTNSLQVPKLPDYAIIDLREPAGPRWPGKVVDAGFFDETWK